MFDHDETMAQEDRAAIDAGIGKNTWFRPCAMFCSGHATMNPDLAEVFACNPWMLKF